MTRHLKFDAVDKAALRALQAHYTGFIALKWQCSPTTESFAEPRSLG